MRLLTILALMCPVTAWGNGQIIYVWISHHAVEHLPAGDLRDLLTRDDVNPALVHGTMFPDGGYAVNNSYGETSHWEPFQGAYLDWIVANHEPPWDDDASRHIAFLMGMGSHGMADQVFDSLYMERSKVHDAGLGWTGTTSFDEATDVVWASQTGAQEVPEKWVPSQTLVELFDAHTTDSVDVETLDNAQALLGIAVNFVGLAGANPVAVSDYAAEYPWGADNLDDRDVPGSPRCEGEIVALYWQDLWDRLHGEPAPTDLVMATRPPDGALGHEIAFDHVEARISVVFKRGLLRDDVTVDRFAIRDPEGTDVPFDVWLFYRDNSHVVHLIPQQDWGVNTIYTVSVLPGLSARDGSSQGVEHSFTVSTALPTQDTGAPDTGADTDRSGCGCTAATGVFSSGGTLFPCALALLWLRRRSSPSV